MEFNGDWGSNNLSGGMGGYTPLRLLGPQPQPQSQPPSFPPPFSSPPLETQGGMPHPAHPSQGRGVHPRAPFYPTGLGPTGRAAPGAVLGTWLYIGDQFHAKDRELLRGLGITHVVNATGGPSAVPNHFSNEQDGIPALVYARVPWDDHPTQSLAPRIHNAIAWISQVHRADPAAKILVHCHAGVSRSASIVILYLMRAFGLTYDAALGHLRRSRPQAHPNPGFEAQLRALETSFEGRSGTGTVL